MKSISIITFVLIGYANAHYPGTFGFHSEHKEVTQNVYNGPTKNGGYASKDSSKKSFIKKSLIGKANKVEEVNNECEDSLAKKMFGWNVQEAMIFLQT